MTPDAARRYVNWLVDTNQTIRPRPAIVNTDFSTRVRSTAPPGHADRHRRVHLGLEHVRLLASTWCTSAQDRTVWAKDLITMVVTTSSADITTFNSTVAGTGKSDHVRGRHGAACDGGWWASS
jgi:hypothetical protein